MSCRCAKYDSVEGRYYCYISGSQCMYLIPNSKKCAEEFGEGPDVEGLLMENYLGVCVYGMLFIRSVPEDIRKLTIKEFDIVCKRETEYIKNQLNNLGFRPNGNLKTIYKEL